MISVCFAGRGGVAASEDRSSALARHWRGEITAFSELRDRPGLLGILPRLARMITGAGRHDVLWLMTQNPASILGAWVGRLIYGTPFVVDTGDLIYESARTTGKPFWIAQLMRFSERLSVRLPNAVVVRGSAHVPILESWGCRDVVLIPDGVECDEYARVDASDLRRELGLGEPAEPGQPPGRCVVLGVLATIGWEARLKIPSPGWDLVEALNRLRDLPVRGLVVGDGPGLPALRDLAARRGVSERIVYVGRVPHGQIPRYLSAMDIVLHTALHNPMSAVRTTGKLPLLLAAGCLAVVSNVGEASRVLAGTGALLDFEPLSPARPPGGRGTRIGRDARTHDLSHDRRVLDEYADRLGQKLRSLIAGVRAALPSDGEADPRRFRALGPEIARREFDYGLLAERAAALVRRVASRSNASA